MNNLLRRTRLWIVVLFSAGWCLPMVGATWYVRPDGGTRYSSNMKQGQCDGTADAPYPGHGTNQHCAFNQAVYLWSDGSYADGVKLPAFGWIGKGGDTYILRGSIQDGVTYRVGWANPNNSKDDASGHYWGLAGDPYHSGALQPPSGTPGHPTRILGGNYGACTGAKAKTQLHGGYGVLYVLNLTQTSNVDVECLDITDFSSCAKSSPDNGCSRNPPLSDFATSGIEFNLDTKNILVQDVSVHGTAANGIHGPTGGDVTLRRISLRGNAAAGWDADDGTTGTGKLLVNDFDISWNGCQEEYPITHALPYVECLDDNVGGYGDGFGTATLVSKPGWQATFDTGTVSYNTQDGLDALHLQGAGSSMTIRNVLAFGNMGQQIKIGGAAGSAEHNRLVGNCAALHENIPGTPPGFNRHLTDFCRAANTAVLMTVGKGSRTVFNDNVLYSANATGFEIECDGTAGPCDASSQIEFRNNIFLGFPGGSEGEVANPIYVGAEPNPFLNAGSIFDHNVTFHAKGNWNCPATELKETNAICADPHLKDETWHPFGHPDMSLTAPLPSPTPGSAHRPTSSAGSKKPVHRLRSMVLPAAALGIAIAGGAYLMRSPKQA